MEYFNNHDKLIRYYEDKLEKTKAMWNPDKQVSSIAKERCKEYIAFAESELEAVRNGRNF